MKEDKISENLRDLIGLLVKIETENPPGNEGNCSKFIVEWFREHDIEAELVEEPYKDRPQAVARIGQGDPTVVLNGHLDVVPAGNRDNWKHDPYGAEVEDGKLYGRGSADMKSGIALAMMTALSLRDEVRSEELSGSLVVQGAVGEERAEPGTQKLIELGYDGDYGIVLEPTGLKTATSVKGAAWYEFTVNGVPSHAGSPDEGLNAIKKARFLLDALVEYDETVRQRSDDLVGCGYSTITGIEAGTKENVVPENAKITIDRRFLPEKSIEEIDEEIKEVVDRVRKSKDVEVDWRRTGGFESAAAPVDGALARTFRKNSKEVANVSTDLWGAKFASDMRNFVLDAQMESITWGPGNISQAHSVDEYIDLREATEGLVILKKSVRELLG